MMAVLMDWMYSGCSGPISCTQDMWPMLFRFMAVCLTMALLLLGSLSVVIQLLEPSAIRLAMHLRNRMSRKEIP